MDRLAIRIVLAKRQYGKLVDDITAIVRQKMSDTANLQRNWQTHRSDLDLL
ncbi:MAG: hypothetical protein GKR90_21945 [Pseudomonadales bacterium]|nr:hypothetical protein [Pseudomonadales bacterium]